MNEYVIHQKIYTTESDMIGLLSFLASNKIEHVYAPLDNFPRWFQIVKIRNFSEEDLILIKLFCDTRFRIERSLIYEWEN